MNLIFKLASSMSKTYARRCWWVEEQDLYQEAVTAMLAAQRTYDPEFGSTPHAYFYTVAKRAVTSFLWRGSSPVSAGSNLGELPELGGLFRAPLSDELPGGHDEEQKHLEKDWLERACVAVRQRVMEASPDGLAEKVLLDERKPREVAQALGVPVQKVYGAASRARTRIGQDLDLWRLWRKEQ